MFIYKAAVIGAGQMGAEIAQAITYSGLPVVIKDVNPEAVNRGLARIRAIYQGRVKKGKMTEGEMEQKLALVSGATDNEALKDADIVIEAVYEDLNVKRTVFAELDRVCPEGAILATNTSSLSISAIAAATRRPGKVIGLHFFNPAHVMKLVEVIPGLATATETVDDTMAFAESLRKIPVRVQECAGFLVNRLLMPYLNEAALALEDGAGDPRAIDAALAQFGMPMGPFTLLDMIGIDVAEKVAAILYDAYGPRMAPAALLGELVAAKRLGQKSGAGLYRYDGADDAVLPQILEKLRRARGGPKPGFDPARLLLQMVNEAAHCVQEQVAAPGDIDLAMLAGTGFPQDKGGPLHYADQLGLDTVVAELTRLARDLGPRFWPAPILKRMAGAGYLGVQTKQGFFSY